MPTIEVSHKDLCRLIGKKFTIKEMEDAVLFVKGEIENVSGDLLKIDIKDSNRPDLWSTEGIAREIQGRVISVRINRKRRSQEVFVSNRSHRQGTTGTRC